MYRYPSLRVLLLGGSVGWVTPFLWRFDTDFRAFRHDLLFLKKPPSEVFRDHFFVGSSPFCFDLPPGDLARYLAFDHELGELLCYASGYPDREYADPAAVASALPPEWEPKVLRENPLRFLGSRAGSGATDALATTTGGR